MTPTQILDPEQLKRIENTHKGFLYQHLFAVGCLLLAQPAGVIKVTVEGDEDLEVEVAGSKVYTQIKTRKNQLNKSDIQLTIEQFGSIREEHSKGNRSGTPRLVIVSNVGPGKTLLENYRMNDWPNDVKLWWPSCDSVTERWLPPAWKSIEEAFEWCRSKANKIPYASLAGDVLTWKLVALVQHACTGQATYGHSFLVKELSKFFDQVVVQLQSFPETPKPYIPQTEEPPYGTDTRIRAVIGHSGSGKTAWAAEASSHTNASTSYFDISDTPDAAIAATLVREIVAKILPNNSEERSSVLLPGYTGVESLRSFDHFLSSKGITLCIYLDNVHRADPPKIVELISVTSHIQWVLLLQPSPNQIELLARLNVSAEKLQGWDEDVIAACFKAAGIPIGIMVAQSVRLLTSGSPLFVRSVLTLSADVYDGDVKKCCSEVSESIHPTSTVQDAITSKVASSLSANPTKMIGILSLSEVPFNFENLLAIANSAFGWDKRVLQRTLRKLHDWAIIQYVNGREATLHDSFRSFAAEVVDDLGNECVLNARCAMRLELQKSLKKDSDPLKQRFFIRLMPLTGEVNELIEIASNESEYLRELGLVPEISRILQDYVNNPTTSVCDCFWAFDTLAMWAYDENNLDAFKQIICKMEELVQSGTLKKRERIALKTKRLLLFGLLGDSDSVFKEIDINDDLLSEVPEHRRVLIYNCGVALFHAKKYEEAATIGLLIAKEYKEDLGLGDGLASKNLPEIWESIEKTDSIRSDLKRLADSLNLYAMANEQLQKNTFPARLHAFKFYVLSQAYRSAILVGQNYADELLSLTNTPYESRSFIEQFLLPLVQEIKLIEYVIQVRSQYAVILAYCGEISAARNIISALLGYHIENDERKQELEQQAALINKIAHEAALYSNSQLERASFSQAENQAKKKNRKIGRNEKCPCGSGKKYKKCCLPKRQA